MKLHWIAFFCTFTISSMTQAQIIRDWVTTYDYGNVDVMNDMAVDDSGNVYVTGYTAVNFATNTRDILTVKFNQSGRRIWAQVYNGQANGSDVAAGLVLDRAGNLYVAGKCMDATSDICVLKYSPAGLQEWATQINMGVDDGASAVALDSAGFIYVAGQLNSMASLTKVSPSGSVVWTQTFLTGNYSGASAYKVAADRFGFLHVAGSLYGTSDRSADIAYLKYDTTGTLRSFWSHDGPLQRNDYASSVAVDNSGNAFVAGSQTSRFNTIGGKEAYLQDALIIKYNSFGIQSWVRAYGFGDCEGPEVAIDELNNVHAAGTVTDRGNRDFLVIKFDSNGTQRWARTYEFRDSSTEYAASIALDRNGNVFVAGSLDTLRSGGDTRDFLTTAFDANGHALGVARYGTAGNEDAYKILTDRSRNLYVGGYSQAPQGSDICIIKYHRATTFSAARDEAPRRFHLHQNYPNPFNPTTTIRYELPSTGYVSLKVFDILGREVATLVDEVQGSGSSARSVEPFKSVEFDARGLSSGVYFYRLQTDGFTASKTLLLMK